MHENDTDRGKRRRSRAEGIEPRHARSCPAGADPDAKCRCTPSYRASVYHKGAGRRIRKTFSGKGALTAAKQWRAEALTGVAKGTVQPPSSRTVREELTAWIDGADAGTIRTRSGDPYKPSARRSYRNAIEGVLLPELGALRVSELRRGHVQALADRLLAGGTDVLTGRKRKPLDPSTTRNHLMPLRALCRRLVEDGVIPASPCASLRLPAVRGKRERIPSPQEAAKLIQAAPERDRRVWATAAYAGLRRGELQALRWADVNLGAGVIEVARSWHERTGTMGAPKSAAGKRRVPIVGKLHDVWRS